MAEAYGAGVPRTLLQRARSVMNDRDRIRMWLEWVGEADSRYSEGRWIAEFRRAGFSHVHMDRATLSASFKLKSPTVADVERLISSSSVVSRRPLDVPVMVWRRGSDWRRPSWSLTKAGADAGRYRDSSGSAGDWWSAGIGRLLP